MGCSVAEVIRSDHLGDMFECAGVHCASGEL
jgi:hypothetical protein